LKPSIAWLGGDHADAIWQAVRSEFQPLGYQEAPPQSADIVCFSAGDPFWADPGHSMETVKAVLDRPAQKVVIVERHEYGWSNYENPELRAQNAWLGVESYGRDTDCSGGKHGDKHAALAFLCRTIDPGRLLYFRREFFRHFDYPAFVHPINFCIPPAPPPLKSFEDFQRRPLDLMCIWGETHDHRRIIANTLKGQVAGGWLKADIRSPVYAGDVGRLPGGEGYRRPHERARLFVTSDGHGLGGGREWELITTLAMIRKRSWMILPHDFVHAETCLEWGAANNPDSGGLVDTLVTWLADHRKLYGVYERGYVHALKFHTARARAEYVEEKMRERGWTS
jgi:hypothetical protein